MKTTDDMKALGALAGALAKAQGEFGAVTKNAKNPHLRNRYADLASVMAAVSPALAANSLGVVGGVETADGDPRHATLTVRLIHAGGGWVEVTMPVVWEQGRGVNIAQSFGGGLTYARRYAVMTLLGLAPEDEDDGCSAGPMDRGGRQQRQGQPPAQAKRGPSQATPQRREVAQADPWAEFAHACKARLGVDAEDVRRWAVEALKGTDPVDATRERLRALFGVLQGSLEDFRAWLAGGNAAPEWVHPQAHDLHQLAVERGARFDGLERSQAPASALRAVVEFLGRSVKDYEAWRDAVKAKPLDPANPFHVGGALHKLIEAEAVDFTAWCSAREAA